MMVKATMNGFLVICIGIVVVFGMRMPKSAAIPNPKSKIQNTDYKALYYADNKLFNEALLKVKRLEEQVVFEHERCARLHEQKVAAERQRDSYLLKINQAKSVLQ